MVVLADLSGSRIAFYATVGTVLPIIMLALGFQIRARSIFPWSEGSLGTKTAIALLLFAVAWVGVMGFAEFNALFSLSDGRNDNYRLAGTGTAIGVVVLCVGTIEAVLDQLIDSISKDREDALREHVGTEVEQAVKVETGRRRRTPMPRATTEATLGGAGENSLSASSFISSAACG